MHGAIYTDTEGPYASVLRGPPPTVSLVEYTAPMPNWMLPAGFAAFVAIAATVFIERLGGKRGGLIGTLPSTIVPATFGIYASAVDYEAFQAAMYITPAGMLVNGCFLYFWRLIPPILPRQWGTMRLVVTTILSLVGWGVLAVGFAVWTSQLQRRGVNLAGPSVGLTVLLALFGVWACSKNPPAPSGTRRVGMLALLSRGVLAGAAIGLAVVLAGAGGALLAGILAVFPAIFMTTMISIWISQGEAVQAGAVGPMMLGGTSVSVFAILAAWLVPMWGPALGCLACWCLAAVGVTLPAWRWLQRRAV